MPTPSPKSLAIVVPCYNEEEVLPETLKRLGRVLEQLVDARKVGAASCLWFVDDGSADSTWALIGEAAARSPRVRGVKLSRNRGHQNALLAGLLTAEGDALVSIDADLQDDVGVIADMVDAWLQGADVVYGVRRGRDKDSVFKRASAQLYYRILQRFGVDVVYNHADFRLLSRRAVEALREYPETNLFLRGVVRHLGYPSATVHYDRHERFAGESKYPLTRMLALAIDGVTSFTATPLRFIAALGVVVFLGSICMTLWVLWVRLFSGAAVPGWASSVIPMYFLGGVQLLSIGVLGEYTAKLYFEVKQRPRFFIDEIVGQHSGMDGAGAGSEQPETAAGKVVGEV
jgi:glycosyltransferase involved in cell wall biosynthesis